MANPLDMLGKRICELDHQIGANMSGSNSTEALDSILSDNFENEWDEIENFVEGMKNPNTSRKTRSDVAKFQNFLKARHEDRPMHMIL